MNRKPILRKLFPLALAIAWGLMINSMLLGGFSNVMAYDYGSGKTCKDEIVGGNTYCATWGCYICISCNGVGTCKYYRIQGTGTCPSNSCTQ